MESGVLPVARGGTGNAINQAATAVKLAAARTLTLTGDGSWSVSFDGSGNAAGTLTLANSGATAGSYPKVTVNAKGLVTGGAALTAADIPSLDTSKLGSGVLPVARGGTGNAVNQAATAVKLAAARTLTLTGDGSWSVSFDGSGNASGVFTLANSGATAGSYPKVTVNAKGLVTGGAALTAADIPGLDVSKLISGVIPIPRGGTGGATPAAARVALGAGVPATATLGATPSWWKDEDTGLIFQFGRTTVGARSSFLQTLPVTFPNAALQPFVTDYGSATGANYAPSVEIISDSQIQLSNGDAGASIISWFVIGY